MRSLELPPGSYVVAAGQQPDSVYVLKKGISGIFDKLERLLAIVYKEESFGLEAIFGFKSPVHVKSLSAVEIDMYEPDEFKDLLNENFRMKIIKEAARRLWEMKRRYNLEAEDRMRDLLKEMIDSGLGKNEVASVAISLSVSDALAFERVRGEFGI